MHQRKNAAISSTFASSGNLWKTIAPPSHGGGHEFETRRVHSHFRSLRSLSISARSGPIRPSLSACQLSGGGSPPVLGREWIISSAKPFGQAEEGGRYGLRAQAVDDLCRGA